MHLSLAYPHRDSENEVELVNADTVCICKTKFVHLQPKDMEAIIAFFGRQISVEWEQDKKLISRRILITKPELNGNRTGAAENPI